MQRLISWDLGDPFLQIASATLWLRASEDLSPGQGLVAHAEATADLGYAAELTTTVEVTICPPIESLAMTHTAEAPFISGTQPVTISFQGWAQEGLLPLSYSWESGDGRSEGGQMGTRTFDLTGTISVSVTAVNATGSDTYAESLTLEESPPSSTCRVSPIAPRNLWQVGERNISPPVKSSGTLLPPQPGQQMTGLVLLPPLW